MKVNEKLCDYLRQDVEFMEKLNKLIDKYETIDKLIDIQKEDAILTHLISGCETSDETSDTKLSFTDVFILCFKKLRAFFKVGMTIKPYSETAETIVRGVINKMKHEKWTTQFRKYGTTFVDCKIIFRDGSYFEFWNNNKFYSYLSDGMYFNFENSKTVKYNGVMPSRVTLIEFHDMVEEYTKNFEKMVRELGLVKDETI